MTNAAVAKVMREIAALLDMDGVPFKPRAYEKVAYAIEALDEPLADAYARGGLKALEQLPGVGKGIAERIEELLTTGRLKYYDELHKKVPADISELTAIEGIGPKHVKALYEALRIRTVADLEEAARAGKIRDLPHFGEKSEQKILKGIEFLRGHSGRMPLGTALPVLDDIRARLRAIAGVREVAIAGSVRRRKETVGDGDILVVSKHPDRVMDFFVTLPEVAGVIGKGSTKSSVKLDSGLQVDLRVVPAESFGAALNYFTGSKDHNVALRRIAIDKGLKLNEYGVFRGDEQIAGKTEQDVYAALDLPYIEPELRENVGEIEAARAGRLPALIEYGQVRGDLQTQTNWTDGANSIEEMVDAARRLGREYIAITDHTKSLAMMGADEVKLRRQLEAIRTLGKQLKGFTLLAGAEVNINKDGTLDIDDDVLAELDVVGIAVHSHFNLARAEMTRRIIRAMENPHADILFHPTGRVINKREAYDIDIDAIIAAAKRTGTVLEVDAYPERLDLKDDHVRKAVTAGAKIVIDSDAHSVNHLDYIDYGVATARRGWAEKSDVLNTLPVAKFLAALKGAKKISRPARRRS
ncbi:MAG TPA: DNA polymerase/3'-5' exonuclease PolX [Candidatus Kryptonia bacterium]|nr:DNA polymerase/3'-5' exonuclease PolX [Candidatus Kryptonia bacterium]